VEGAALLCEGGEVTVLCGGAVNDAEPLPEIGALAELDAPEGCEAVAELDAPESAEAEPSAGKTGIADAPAGSTLVGVRLGSWPGRESNGRVKFSAIHEVVRTST